MKQTLLVLVCLCVFTSTVFAVTGHVRKRCCLHYTSNIPPIGRLRNYEIQEYDGRCMIKAVIFNTKRNRLICADPDNTTVKQLIKQLNPSADQETV